QLKAVGGAERDAERVEHIWVERISSKRLLVQFYGPVDLPEDECVVPEGAWQQFRSGVYLADALVICLRSVPIPGDVHRERGAQGLSNLLCNLVLYLENVDEVAVVGLGPQMHSV